MKVPVHNNTAMTMFVAGLMIPPGETRHFEEEQVPLHLRPPKAEEEAPAADPGNPLAKLLEGSVDEVKKAFPGLKTEDLEKLGELEQTGKARKTLLGAIAEELLNRAAASDLKAKLEAIPGLSDEDLGAQLDAETGKGDNANAELLAAMNAEAKKRTLAAIPELTDEQLAASIAGAGEDADADVLAALKAESDKRAAGNQE